MFLVVLVIKVSCTSITPEMGDLSKVVLLFCWFSVSVMAAKAGTTNEGRMIKLQSIILSYICTSRPLTGCQLVFNNLRSVGEFVDKVICNLAYFFRVNCYK